MSLQALERGAQDYLVKSDATAREIERTLRHAIQRQQILNEKSAFGARVGAGGNVRCIDGNFEPSRDDWRVFTSVGTIGVG